MAKWPIIAINPDDQPRCHWADYEEEDDDGDDDNSRASWGQKKQLNFLGFLYFLSLSGIIVVPLVSGQHRRGEDRAETRWLKYCWYQLEMFCRNCLWTKYDLLIWYATQIQNLDQITTHPQHKQCQLIRLSHVILFSSVHVCYYYYCSLDSAEEEYENCPVYNLIQLSTPGAIVCLMFLCWLLVVHRRIISVLLWLDFLQTDRYLQWTSTQGYKLNQWVKFSQMDNFKPQ